MGRIFHQEHTHGRAFHGVEARSMLALHRRDSHGSELHMHVPAELDNKMNFIHNDPSARLAANNKNNIDVVTVESVVYATMPQTFAGDAAFSTPALPSPTPASGNDAAAAYESAKAAAGQPHFQSSAVGASPSYNTAPVQRTRSAEGSQSLQTTPAQYTPEGSSSSTGLPNGPLANTFSAGTAVETQGAAVVGGTPLSATHSGNANIIASKDDGMSGGAKAGLAFGIIIALALCAGLIFFCWRRKKAQNDESKEKVIDEKRGSFFDRGLVSPTPDQRGSLVSTHTASTAPRLSLRPVTQFLPNILDNRKSAGAVNTLNAPPMSEKPKSPWERGPIQNPFDDAANNEKAAEANPTNPFDEGDGIAVAAAGRSSPNHSQKGSWEGSEPPTPKSAKFGTAAAIPVGAKGPNNVHRVQLEFKPSMEDEIELVSGQLVRMLHEYDDGWALCIRMDRSQQGVCPRTCLSKLPVKPRPQGPPPNGPHGRPMGPPSQGGPRSFSPQGPPNAMVPRPLTPNSQNRERSQTMGRQSPAPQDNGHMRQRSQSAAGADGRPMTPNAANMPSRKPVPGMAL